MNRYYAFLVFAFTNLLIGCKKRSNTIEVVEKKEFLKDWEISKTSFDFGNPRDMFFINAEVGFVVGYDGNIFKTVNSGNSWQKQQSGTTLPLVSAFF